MAVLTKKGRLMATFFLVAGEGLEPLDLRVMSPTSYHLLHPAIYLHEKYMPTHSVLFIDSEISRHGAGNRDRTGTILTYHEILSLGRLPVPPFRRPSCCLYIIP